MLYLAIDLGQKRTGLAVGTDVTRQAQPLRVVEVSDDQHRLNAIGQAIEEYGPAALVLGLPLNMDASEGPMARQARRFAGLLAERFGLPVYLVDERLSSEAADSAMSQSGLTHAQKQSRRDALAAATILRDFFQRQ